MRNGTRAPANSVRASSDESHERALDAPVVVTRSGKPSVKRFVSGHVEMVPIELLALEE